MSSKKAKLGNVDDYDSSFEDDEDDNRKHKKAQRQDLTEKSEPAGSSKSKPSSRQSSSSGLPGRSVFEQEQARADSYKYSYLSLNSMERHRKLINDYFLYYPGSKNLLQRDATKDRNDHDIIKDNHKFIWNESDEADTWEKQMSKKYYDKLFKEYCICDMSFFKQGKYAMRWRTEAEVVNGKGQFSCGGRKCMNTEELRSWEVNFTYMEESVKKNALVKLRLCPECSKKLNYHQKRKDVTKVPKRKTKRRDKSKKSVHSNDKTSSTDTVEPDKNDVTDDTVEQQNDNIWKDPVQIADMKSREEEFDEYLDDLLL